MEKQKIFGLVGKNISYSFSKKYYTDKFNKLMLKNYRYQFFDIAETEDIPNVFRENVFGLNVTIPYKEKIIKFLDELSEEAQKIGAVNCIAFKENKKIGHNTDAFGFEKMLALHIENQHDSALILGNGGAAKAVKYVFEKWNIPYQIVARNTDFNFENLTKKIVEQHKIIVQCTPVGTFPNTENCLPFPFEGVGKAHLIIDLIYNPEYTQFIKEAIKKGAKTANGFYMLEQQAEKAWEIWNY
jgi:shikimate dehydrogenase